MQIKQIQAMKESTLGINYDLVITIASDEKLRRRGKKKG